MEPRYAQVREVVYDFFGSRYAACLAGLGRLAPLLRLDMHLAPHLDALHAAVSTLIWGQPRHLRTRSVCDRQP